MRAISRSVIMVLILQQTVARIIRKPPAFSTPMYSNSYLPAAMQVIFHSVEQLKLLQSEEMSQGHSSTELSSTIETMKYQSTQAQSTTPRIISTISTTAIAEMYKERTDTPELSSTSSPVVEASSRGSSETYGDPTEAAQHAATSTASVSTGDHEESPEVNEETTETNYATPETNHESPEPVQEVQESNQEIPEQSEEEKSSTVENPFSEMPSVEASQQRSTQASVSEALDSEKKREPTIDSVVGEIYEILKPTASSLIEESDAADEAKSTTGISIEKMESIEEEEDETRFTLLGEKVAQVPRPSLNGYLRRTKVPPSQTLQQLANLYDALSKDARKQGFARFAGYSDEVLKTLQSSAEGGVGPQLKGLLEKVVERNELTRDDAKRRAAEALRDLDDTASPLNKDLRRLLPLRFTA